MAWTYSDWITKATGSSERLERLRLHVQEVSDHVSGSYSVPGISKSASELVTYLNGLKQDEQREAQTTEEADGTRVGWSRGRALL